MHKPPLTNRRAALQKLGAASLCTSPWFGGTVLAAVFMDVEQAQKLLLPNAEAFQALGVPLDAPLLNAIAKACDTRVPKNFNPKIWRATQADKALGWVISDRVIGKYDLIDYAAGFDAQGTTLGMEVLTYRESHGSEIKQTAWRKQFVGKRGPDAMHFADDIRNISGATLSCQHVTEGMQRLSALASFLVSRK
ncbi:FMN-binding protein [Limnohabitans sp.]|uniref:FMN-binding protein n=1 Tax=Limnohabitans sp. TaxID=1907725 RepID=UPI00286EEB5E|nr:FMN-binding protein [Limnohabitans sp.]